VKGSYRNRIFTAIFLLGIVFSFVALNGCMAGKQVSANEPIKIKGGKEILVARDVIYDHLTWCGRTNALVYVVDEAGTFWHDIETGKKVQVAGWGNFPLVCTPDGKWVIYKEYLVEDYLADETDAGEPDPLAEFLGVIFTDKKPMTELWRYELETGRRQRFAVIFEEEERGVGIEDSPSEGIRIYLGHEPEPNTKVKMPEMPEPQWKFVWSLQQRRARNEVWFNDFSAVIGSYRNRELDRDVLEVEVFSPRRKVFTVYPVAERQSFHPLFVDSKGRVFIRKDRIFGEDAEGKNEVVDGCDIDFDKEAVSCAPVLEIEGGEESQGPCPQCPVPPVPTGSYINRLDVFSDDETMLFTAEGDTCVRIMRIGEKEAGCFTSSRYEMGSDVVISPDERWVAFVVDRRIAEGKYKTLENYTNDLYLVEVKKD